MKTCTKCGETKDFSEFHKNKGTKDNFSRWCKQCCKAHYNESKTNLSMQLKREITRTIRLDNKILSKDNKKLCTMCKQITNIDNLSDYTGMCVDCGNRRSREWRQKNKDVVNEKQKIYRDNNKEKVREEKREWYIKNKEKVSEKIKIYVEKNKEKVRERQKKWEEKNKEKLNEYRREYQKQYQLKKKLEKLQQN